MFYGATSFNSDLSAWDVSSMTDMSHMFTNAASFNQNLGTWYIVPADTEFDAGGDSLDVTTISAQNPYLRSQSPTYGMGSGGDSDLFEMTGSTLAFKSTPDVGSYTAIVRASGSGIFENGNNWRMLEITVRDSPVAQAGDDQTVGEGDTVTLSGSATDPDGDPITYTWSQTGPATPRITFANASAPSTTFVAPSVTGDTTFTLALTASDGMLSATDTLNITVSETDAAFVTTWTASNSDRSITLPMKGTYSILWGDGSHDENVSGSRSHTYGAAGTYTVTVLGNNLEYIHLYGILQTRSSSSRLSSGATRNGPPCTRRFPGRPTWCTAQPTRRTCRESPTMSSMFRSTPPSTATSPTGTSRPSPTWAACSMAPRTRIWGRGTSCLPTPTLMQAAPRLTSRQYLRRTHTLGAKARLRDGIRRGDSDLFEMTGSTLAFRNAQDAGSYTAIVRASGSGIFENGNNWRMLEITVRDSPVAQAGDDQTVGEGDTVTLSGSATDPDGDPITYTWSQTGPATPRITFANASAAPSTTFVAPSVTGDTTFTLALTASGGMLSATDTLNITVKETGAAFVTTWTASNSDRNITLPMRGTYSILWGDGSHDENVSGSRSHTYGAAGTYTVTVLGNNLEYIHLYGDTANASQLKSIEQWGDTKWTSMHEAFYWAANMVYRATDTPDLSGVTDMNRMFYSASSFNGDLSSWDVSSVTDMSNMFLGASSFNGDLSSWDVSSVTNMYSMFSGTSSFNGNISSWDVSSVTDMYSMFSGASSFNGGLSSWDVSSVTDTSWMFYDATVFNHPLDGWDVSSVTAMDRMFLGAIAFNHPLDGWDVSSVTAMDRMFLGTPSFNQNLGTWYIVPADTDFDAGGDSLIVTTISAQNPYLRNHNPAYGDGIRRRLGPV